MDYEQKHPISQEVYEYLKNTPKKQIDKDWFYIFFKETDPELHYKQKYKEALERAKKLYGQGTITESLGYVFPELIEDEDERTRKELLTFIKNWRNPSNIGRPHDFPMFTKNKEQCDKYIVWLEKQYRPL